MKPMAYKKYKPYPKIELPDRTWPNQRIENAPIWCSVDLRDGNQSLPIPMTVEEKLLFFDLLVKIGFKEIEVGFPSASQVEFDFLRRLVTENRIPDDVTVQVLTQARDHLIRKTFEALKGVKRAIVHFYNSTSIAQRKQVFKKTKQDIIKIATDGAALIKKLASDYPETELICEYSPESYTGTELDYAIEICQSVMAVIKPTKEHPMIINLPATVEMATPNLYADSVEYFIRNLKNRDHSIISLHTHNDRGTAVAASELALLAGAQRIEGTLFGSGERTGNVDLITIALNLFTQGMDPELDFSNLSHIEKIYTTVTKLKVPLRQPYAGELVYTAFSGSHQDAISKGMKARECSDDDFWTVPYLPIDPRDVGRDYEAIIRINSQSGKGGIAFILETEYDYQLPKAMHPEFGRTIQSITDQTGEELSSQAIFDTFKKEYLAQNGPVTLVSWNLTTHPDQKDSTLSITTVTAKLDNNGAVMEVTGHGNGPIDAFVKALRDSKFIDIQISDYAEHALGNGSEAKAVCYVQITDKATSCYGVGEDTNIALAPIKAVLSALNRKLKHS